MEFGQLIEYSKIFLFKNNPQNEAGRLFTDLSLFFKKVLYQVKTKGLQLSLIYFDSPQLDIQ